MKLKSKIITRNTPRRRRKRIASIVIGLFSVALIAYCAVSFSLSGREMLRSVALVEYVPCHALVVDGKERLFFSNIDTTFSFPALASHPTRLHTQSAFSTGFWVNRFPFFPSCKGRLLTAVHRQKTYQSLSSSDLQKAIKAVKEDVLHKYQALEHRVNEIDYYLSVHSVKDEGYTDIAGYANQLQKEYEEMGRILKLLDAIKPTARLSVVDKTRYAAVTSGGRKVMTCIAASPHNDLLLLQTADASTPDGCTPVTFLPLNIRLTGSDVLAVSHAGMRLKATVEQADTAVILPGRMLKAHQLDIHRALLTDGSPIFSRRGNLIGIFANDKIIPCSEAFQTLYSTK